MDLDNPPDTPTPVTQNAGGGQLNGSVSAPEVSDDDPGTLRRKIGAVLRWPATDHATAQDRATAAVQKAPMGFTPEGENLVLGAGKKLGRQIQFHSVEGAETRSVDEAVAI